MIRAVHTRGASNKGGQKCYAREESERGGGDMGGLLFQISMNKKRRERESFVLGIWENKNLGRKSGSKTG